MALFARLQASSDIAQSVLAQMQGMRLGGNNTILATGKKVPGVYGSPRVIFIGVSGGGYRKRTETILTITKTKLAVAPIYNTQIVRSDMSPQVRYNVDHVDTQDPLKWVLTLVSLGV